MQPPPDSPATPRIRITREPGSGPAGELPFVIGVLADFSGMPEQRPKAIRYRRFVDVQLANLDAVLEACAPGLALQVVNQLSGDEDPPPLRADLRFRRMEDYDPDGVLQQIAPLRKLLELRTRLASLCASLQGNDKLEQLLQDALHQPETLSRLKTEVVPEPAPPAPAAPPETPPPARTSLPPATPAEPGVWSRKTPASVLDELVEVSRPETARQKEETRDWLKDLVGQVLQGEMSVSRDTEAMISARIAQIDDLLSRQLREVLHHPAFQRLESCWRGLHFLLRHTRKFAQVKVRILNITKKELLVQFQRERERYDAPIYRRIVDDAAGTSGGEPFSLLIADFEIGRAPEDVTLCEKMARLGAAAHVPFVAAAAPGLLGVESFSEIVDAFQLHRVFDSTESGRWNHLRERPESRYLGVILPRMLARLPYSHWENPVASFNIDEGVDGRDHSKFLWGSAIWAFAASRAEHFHGCGWFGIRSPGARSAVSPLPVFTYPTEDHDVASIGPAEVPINDTRYLELRALGLIPVCQISGTDSVEFFEAWSCHKPKIDPDEDPPTTYESAELDCILDVSRIAHYLRDILRDRRQSFSSARDCEEYLRKWIAPYVAPDYARDTSVESAFPLVGADFRIVPGTDPRRAAVLEASLLPKRTAGALRHPVSITIPVVLPWALAESSAAGSGSAVQQVVPAPMAQGSAGFAPGREQFIRRMLLAEACITKRKLDVAVAILEELAGQIDRHHLEEWESPQLVTHVWDLLRRCYLLTEPSGGADGRAAVLLRRICRLDPSRVIE